MRFTTDYGTIEFLADDDKDVAALKNLLSVLPKKAESFYDDGDYDILYGPQKNTTYNGCEYGKKMTVSFNR